MVENERDEEGAVMLAIAFCLYCVLSKRDNGLRLAPAATPVFRSSHPQTISRDCRQISPGPLLPPHCASKLSPNRNEVRRNSGLSSSEEARKPRTFISEERGRIESLVCRPQQPRIIESSRQPRSGGSKRMLPSECSWIHITNSFALSIFLRPGKNTYLPGSLS